MFSPQLLFWTPALSAPQQLAHLTLLRNRLIWTRCVHDLGVIQLLLCPGPKANGNQRNLSGVPKIIIFLWFDYNVGHSIKCQGVVIFTSFVVTFSYKNWNLTLSHWVGWLQRWTEKWEIKVGTYSVHVRHTLLLLHVCVQVKMETFENADTIFNNFSVK